jgi:PqqD family protein of HPr-rel-A system
MINTNIAISETGLVFNPATGESFVVNEVGLEIMKLAGNNTPKEEICNAILEEYDIDPETVERDVAEFIYSLARYQIIANEKN